MNPLLLRKPLPDFRIPARRYDSGGKNCKGCFYGQSASSIFTEIVSAVPRTVMTYFLPASRPVALLLSPAPCLQFAKPPPTVKAIAPVYFVVQSVSAQTPNSRIPFSTLYASPHLLLSALNVNSTVQVATSVSV